MTLLRGALVVIICAIAAMAASVTRYLDPAASGTGDGTSWTNAYTTTQAATDAAASGDTILARGTDVLSATVDIDGNSGAATKPIVFRGCNASGVNDGTYYTINGNDAAANAIKGNGPDYWVWENVRFTNTTSDAAAFVTGTCNLWAFWNCKFDLAGSGASGLNGGTILTNCQFIQCTFADNPLRGVSLSTDNSRFIGCYFLHNGSYGCIAGSAVWIACVFHGNVTEALRPSGHALVMGCVIDGTTGVGLKNLCPTVAIANRFTYNSTYGTDTSSTGCMYLGLDNYASNNTTAPYRQTPYMGDATNNWAGTLDGYVNRSANNFSMSDTAVNRRIRFVIGSKN